MQYEPILSSTNLIVMWFIFDVGIAQYCESSSSKFYDSHGKFINQAMAILSNCPYDEIMS